MIPGSASITNIITSRILSIIMLEVQLMNEGCFVRSLMYFALISEPTVPGVMNP
mgnify:CR=1 FL=1